MYAILRTILSSDRDLLAQPHLERVDGGVEVVLQPLDDGARSEKPLLPEKAEPAQLLVGGITLYFHLPASPADGSGWSELRQSDSCSEKL